MTVIHDLRRPHVEQPRSVGEATVAVLGKPALSRVWAERDRLRLFPLVERWHRLGPRSAFELLDELIGIDPFLADDAECLLQRYAKLDADVVAALNGHNLKMPLAVIDGSKP